MKTKADSFRKWTLWGAGIFCLLGIPFVVRAVTLQTLPYRPTMTTPALAKGQTISADGLWGNFNALNTSIADLNRGKLGTVTTIASSLVPGLKPGTNVGVYASCPSGMYVVGGGCDNNSFVTSLFINRPDPVPVATGWLCGFVNNSTLDASNEHLQAYVICAGP